MKHTLSSSNLIKRVFKTEAPERYVSQIPAQAIFLAIKDYGLSSSTDLLEIASLEQCRLLLDFDCWEKDRFSEENFWEWLSLADEENGLKHLEKLLKYVDFRLIGILIAKYVQIEIFDDGNDTPPGPGFYTPDQGFTWLKVCELDSTRSFYLNRFLALIFDKDPDLFYQLSAIPTISTISTLEEESYTDRNKRVVSEGVPEMNYAWELTTPLLPHAIKQEIAAQGRKETIEDIPIVEPLVYDSSFVQPFASLLSSNISINSFECEITLLINAAVVRWSIPFYEIECVRHLSQKVKGAINIGLEEAVKLSGLGVLDLYEILGLQKLFRFGLWHLNKLGRFARGIPEKLLQLESIGSEAFSILACARETIPEIPNFLMRDGSIKTCEGSLEAGSKAIEYSDEIAVIKKYLDWKLHEVHEV